MSNPTTSSTATRAAGCRGLRRTGALAAACIGVLVVAAPALGDAVGKVPPAADAPWMPVDVGLTKLFVQREETHFVADGTSLGDETLVGTREDVVMPAPASRPKATAELRVTKQLAGDSGTLRQVERMFVTPTDSAYLVHGLELDFDGQKYSLTYPKPAIALKENAKPGERWHVSTEEIAGLRGETWGEIVGLQDARTPAGLFEKCLVVRYTGTVEGVMEVPGAGPMKVSNGRVSLTEWHARGIGVVLSKEELTQTLRAENGMQVDASVVSQASLKELRHAAPASPVP